MAIDLSLTYGQFLMATFVATALWGVTCIQTLMYFVIYDYDRWNLKTLVAGLWVLDCFHEMLCVQGVWHMFIPKYGYLPNVTDTVIPFALEPMFLLIVVTIAQIFFGWRIWCFSNKRRTFPAILMPLILGKVAATVVFTRNTARGESLKDPGMIKLVAGIFFVNAVTDVIIATTMCILLWRGKTGLGGSDRMVHRLINASVSTGACPAVVSLSVVATGAAMPNGFVYLVGVFALCPIYCNAVFANLNSREYIRGSSIVDSVAVSRLRSR